ncbi:polysaccharide deacetylase family protein [Bradyrhizobium sp. ISRA443]|uniref:polysaccharide deacetylase family protein n=1 Tax=unclassified Bradyrhizobium TaxID=2631580 RepID=UPI002478630A|nr:MULTISPECIES: polysaccharide deacetylase family protein [unclassified Bradyrhizobium]WGR94289.1 polysaccharide deacetylase family protein [Bradyrhizobium sp. ISRA435]WGR98989.1 polysaccharide deacetylase family protein [Bradyrhizobium sp. ISRA436]WGS05880.1 polysaccharide deacetylase family protein [Bradyrhizobium sp. ISRA437]WGS12766.1 polysaccharide deacetylase family protein [Bradyrhizobium sp. ISRA443]
MKQLRNTVIRAGLEALYFSGAHVLLRPIFAGVGAIFMLHHVRPRRGDAFQPNHHLEVEPDFLRAMLTHLRALDVDVISIDEAHRRLTERNFARRFACFTFDDGYRDNRDFALPVMREFDAPLTVYVTSDFADGSGRPWWIALERLISAASAIEVPIGGSMTRLDTSTAQAKQAAFDRIHDWLRALPGERDVQREISALCIRHGVDETTIARELCLSWDELRKFADDPLVTIGAHTVSHCNLAKQSETIASFELATSRARIEDALQRPALHLAYPYGDRTAAGQREFALAKAIGFRTAVTTRPGMLFAESADHLTALQRVSLNGNYQEARLLPVLTSGAATAVWNGFRRIDAA